MDQAPNDGQNPPGQPALPNWVSNLKSFLTPAKPDPKPLVSHDQATSCANCHFDFNLIRYKYQCTKCLYAFCNDCCHNFVVYGQSQNLQRVCTKCLHEVSPMDYSKTTDIFEGPQGTKHTIILVPSEHGTRYNYIYTAEELSKYYRVVTLDLPGLGSRSSEKMKRTIMIDAIKTCIETYSPTKKATLLGLSMGGYLSLQVAAKYPELVESLILVGCNVEQWGIQQITHGAADLGYNLMSHEDRANLMSKLYPTVSRDRIVRAYMTTVMNYDNAFECATMMMEPEQDFFVDCIKGFPRKILLLSGEKDYRGAEQKFFKAAQGSSGQDEKGGKLQIFPNVGHEVLIHQDTFDAVHTTIKVFLKEDVYPEHAPIPL